MSAEKTSVKSYKTDINVEKQRMNAYSKKFGTTVKSLQINWKKYAKGMAEAAMEMKEKVNKFKDVIKDQMKENSEAVSRIGNGVKFFKSEINKKKKDFHAYARGPFRDYIKAFWG